MNDSNIHYSTDKLSFEQKKQVLINAKSVSTDVRTEILDCSKSFRRQDIDMSFDEMLNKFDEFKDQLHFTIINRRFDDDYIEVCCSTLSSPNYFLYIDVPVRKLCEIRPDDVVPAYENRNNSNLLDDFYCWHCTMSWYNCLCSHE